MKLGPGTAIAITGASSGIGEELAFQFAARGCAVALAARRGDLLERHADAIGKKGGRASAVPADVTKRADVERLMERTFSEFGRLDISVNNAGISPGKGPLVDVSERDVRATFETNLMGYVYGVWAAAPWMEKNGGGLMVFISSVIGKRGIPFSAAYCASKFAVQGLTESIRPELKPKNIRVLNVCPPGVDTPFFEVNQRGRKRDFTLHPVSKIARSIVRACEREKREILPTWDAKLLAWASVLAPGAMDWAIARSKKVNQ
ncbi:MAG: SDR family NAD(P)-dependent oxidoreductase [Elusimicrobia bacterium]|nr:SDR family NAD(P)-dependent oxidoreductase [Elusimicrobiota bacterium]